MADEDEVRRDRGLAGAGDRSATADRPGPDLRARLLEALANLAVLRITTVVGPVTASRITSLDEKTAIDIGQQAGEVASTTINLLQGDVTEVMTPVFVTDQTYRALHAASVQTAKDIVSNNLTLLKEAYLQLRDDLRP
jgi:hypothetical protein